MVPLASQGRWKWGQAASSRVCDGPLGHLGWKLGTPRPGGVMGLVGLLRWAGQMDFQSRVAVGDHCAEEMSASQLFSRPNYLT